MTRFPPRRIIATFACLAAAAIAARPPIASAQALTVISRNGTNYAACGPLFTGPSVNHVFSTGTPTDDPISVSDPGPPATAAASHLVAAATSTGISIFVEGSVMRGAPPNSVGAVADARDLWRFSLAAPACFTFDMQMNLASPQGTAASQGFSFTAAGGGAQVTVDPGSGPLGGGLTAPGSLTSHASGTLTAGTYEIFILGRAETGNAFPYSGSYSNSISINLGPAAVLTDPAPDAVCAGGTGEFTAVASGAGGFQWQIESAPPGSDNWSDLADGPLPPSFASAATASGTGSDTLTIAGADAGAAVRYRCRVSNTCGAATSAAAALTLSGCVGDLNGDGQRDGDDVQPFVNCLLVGGGGCACADADGVNGVDSADVAALVAVLLSQGACP